MNKTKQKETSVLNYEMSVDISLNSNQQINHPSNERKNYLTNQPTR